MYKIFKENLKNLFILQKKTSDGWETVGTYNSKKQAEYVKSILILNYENNFNDDMIKICIHGKPYTKKNSQRIIFNRKTKRHQIVQSNQFLNYEKTALMQLATVKKFFEKEDLQVTCFYHMPDDRSRPDLINLLQATSDILEKSGIIDNDKNIVSYDGSRIAENDKKNPRVEIFIKKINNDN